MDRHADGAAPLEQHALHKGVRENAQIRPIERRMEISGRGAASNAIALRNLIAPDSKLLGAVEVIVAPMARLHRRLNEVVHKRMHGAAVLHAQWPRTSMIIGIAALVA